MPSRVVVFIDAQNTYSGARRAFFAKQDDWVHGQFDPMKLAQELTASGSQGVSRQLEEVRVYRGRPHANKEPKTHSAHMKQCKAWETSGVTVIARPLRYPLKWPTEKPEEKGIDVLMALDFVTFAIDDRYDVGILVSVDTDLKPALEYVWRRTDLGKKVEVAAWRSAQLRGRLSVPGANVWCHWLDKNKYDQVCDLTDYT